MGHNQTKKPRGAGAIFTLLIVAALAYGALQLWKVYHRYDIDKKYEFAMQQCEKYGGQHGEIPVVTEGVYDHRRAPTQNPIFVRAAVFLNNGLNYVEFSSEVVRLNYVKIFERGGPYYRKASVPFSFYRVSISDSGDPLCEPYERYIAAGSKVFQESNFSEAQCVAVEGFDDPALLRAPYELVITDKVIEEGTPVEWNNLEIVERGTGNVVASFNTFSHCFTKTARNRSEGFNYCSGIYGNPKVRPECPESYAKSALVIGDFEKAAFTFTRIR